MLYHDHGLGTDFNSNDKYFSYNTHVEAVTYLQLANELIRQVNPDAITIAEDMSGILVTWFNGRGCDYFRKFGCANLRIDSDSIIVYNDDSGLYQKRCVFTVKVQVPKELTARQDVVELLIPDVMPI